MRKRKVKFEWISVSYFYVLVKGKIAEASILRDFYLPTIIFSYKISKNQPKKTQAATKTNTHVNLHSSEKGITAKRSNDSGKRLITCFHVLLERVQML